MVLPVFETLGSAPYEDGVAFGDTGPYRRTDGRITFAVDPTDPANAAIVDLDLAPREADSRVRFTSDLVILTPEDPEQARGAALVEAVNRGQPLVPYVFHRARYEGPGHSRIVSGDGFLNRHGFVLAFLGWQWDVGGSELIGFDAPWAQHDGSPLEGRTVVEIRPSFAARTRVLSNRGHRPSPVADVDEADAMLTVRDSEDGPVTVIARDRWRFAEETADGVVPSSGHVHLLAGFEPGRIYHVIYTTRGAPIVGAGMLALRDLPAFLRSSDPSNPAAGMVERVHGFGMSQCGRLLRHFLHTGLNRTEQDEAAFDGLMPYVGGARRGEFNHRFAQPSVQLTPNFGHRFPFSTVETVDPFAADGAAATDGLLRCQHAAQHVPKVVQVDTAAEYWRGDSSLAHTDPSATIDLVLPGGVRHYLWAGAQHFPGSVPQSDYNAHDGVRGRYPFNVVDPNTLSRAALVNLDAWVRDGIEPPASSHPRFADGTAQPRTKVLEQLADILAVPMPDADVLPVLRAVDLGPDAERGITRHPVVEGEIYPGVVSAVDADGNEVAGVRLPDLTVPLGTHTGFNPRHPEIGGEDQLISMQGFTRFFPRTAAEGAAAGDSRRPIEERYDGVDDYLAQVTGAAQQLARSGWIVEEDVATLVEDARVRWDYVMEGAPLDERPWIEAVRANR